MNKKTLRIITIISTVLVVITMCTASFGFGITDLTADQQGTEGIQNIGKRVMGILQAVGIVIAVVVLMVLGIKYMMGSAEEKAEYKKTLLPYIIGAGFVFAASALAGIIYNFANSIGA